MEPDIPEMLRSCATNMTELLNMIAHRVEVLEKENDKLKLELKKYATHCKHHGDRLCNTNCGRCSR